MKNLHPGAREKNVTLYWTKSIYSKSAEDLNDSDVHLIVTPSLLKEDKEKFTKDSILFKKKRTWKVVEFGSQMV